jgi:hypothetical protein
MPSQKGLGFIYSALDLLSARYRLTDAIIVLERQDATTQAFRLGRRAVSTEFVTRYGAEPGLYCEPPVVATKDVDLVMSMCRQVLVGQPLGSRAVRPQQETFGHSDQNFEVHETHVESGGIGELRVGVDLKKYLTGRLTPSRTRDARQVVSLLLFVVDAVTLALTLAHVHGPIRFVAGLILGLAIPGWSVIGWAGLKNAALEVSLTMTTSLALIMITAQVLMTINLWHLEGFEIAACVVCLPSLFGLARFSRRRRGQE